MCCEALTRRFFVNDTATTEIYTLSLHDALPISGHGVLEGVRDDARLARLRPRSVPGSDEPVDRKSTRLNSSHSQISYAVFCLRIISRWPLRSPAIDPCPHRCRRASLVLSAMPAR